MRVLLLVHPQLNPQRMVRNNQTERDVYNSLRRLGHNVHVLPCQEDPEPLIEAIRTFKPTIAFNLLEEFLEEAVYDFHPVAICEAFKIPFTGCNPRGLVLSRPKHIAKALAGEIGFETPRWQIMQSEKDVENFSLSFPVIAKLNREDASRGLTLKNVVFNYPKFKACLKKLRQEFHSEILVEEFIQGQDISLGLIGNQKPRAFPPWKLNLPSGVHISSEVIKFSAKTRFKQGIRATRAKLDGDLQKQLVANSKELYERLGLSGYARFDFRLSLEGTLYFLEANANPNLEKHEDFSRAAAAAGIPYAKLLKLILGLGRSYRPRL